VEIGAYPPIDNRSVGVVWAARKVLDLDDYRELVGLDRAVTPPPPVPITEAHTLLRGLVFYLQSEGGARNLGIDLSDVGDDDVATRRLLGALLTVRDPRPLPEPLHAGIDALLQRELRRRRRVAPLSLPRIRKAFPHTSYMAADRCALWQGDITALEADAIVNPANDTLLGCFIPHHACVDSAIHSAAGPRLREDCYRIMQAQGHTEPVGHAKATRGYNLPATYVLHTVGPTVTGTLRTDHEEALAACYRSCLDLAAQLEGVRTVALPAIATGTLGFPKASAARIALRAVAAWLHEHPRALDLVVFDVFSDDTRDAYAATLSSYPLP
jgi:O-acetyl-ADP-ribose deacetylase (regulator of RNase III)